MKKRPPGCLCTLHTRATRERSCSTWRNFCLDDNCRTRSTFRSEKRPLMYSPLCRLWITPSALDSWAPSSAPPSWPFPAKPDLHYSAIRRQPLHGKAHVKKSTSQPSICVACTLLVYDELHPFHPDLPSPTYLTPSFSAPSLTNRWVSVTASSWQKNSWASMISPACFVIIILGCCWRCGPVLRP